MLNTWISTGGTDHDDVDHTQLSVCWADRLLPSAPPLSSCARVLAAPVRVAVATVLYRSAAAFFSSLCHFRMKTSAPSSTRRNHLSADLVVDLAPPFEPDAERLEVFHKDLHLVPFPSPGVAFTPEHLGRRSSPIRVTKPANSILRRRTVVSTRSEFVLRSALA